jgi:hypothetical protein
LLSIRGRPDDLKGDILCRLSPSRI